MALVTAADLKTYMDISLTNRQLDAADMVLAGLQSEMEMYLRRPIQTVEYVEEHTIPSTHTGIPSSSFFTNSNPSNESFTGNTLDNTTYLEPPATIYLLNTPVVSVSKVVLTPSVSVRTFEITTKSLTSNVATLTASKSHSYAVGDVVKVSNIDSTFNGIVTITAIQHNLVMQKLQPMWHRLQFRLEEKSYANTQGNLKRQLTTFPRSTDLMYSIHMPTTLLLSPIRVGWWEKIYLP